MDEKIHKSVDKAVRYITTKRANPFVKKLGLDNIVTGVANTKALNKNFDEREMDCLVDIDSGEALIIEIQTTKISDEKAKAMLDYILYVKKEYNEDVRFGVVYASSNQNIVEYEIEITKELKLRPLTYSFNKEDGDEILNSLTFKINNKQKLTENDMNDLSLISLYSTKRSKEILAVESAKLLSKVDYLDPREKESIINAQLMIISKTVESKEIRKKIRRCLIMNSISILQEERQEGLEEGIEKGRKEGLEEGMEKGLKEGLEEGMEKGLKEGREEERISFIKRLKDKKFSVNEISELTDLPIETINTILKF